MKFEKPSASIRDQLELLKRRGLIIADEARAAQYLSFISYYRLRAYWLPFEVPTPRDGDHALREGTTFEDVLSLYVFDRELRLLTLDAIERIEVALRAQWAHHMAIRHGPHGYLDQKHYAHIERHATAVAQLQNEFTRSKDTFAVHYRKKYTSPSLPPVWMAAELMSFGLLSKWYGDLKHRADRRAISRRFGLDDKVLKSVAHHISHVRNIGAHHARLWNKRFTVTMMVPRRPSTLADAMWAARPHYIYNTLVMLDYLLSRIAPGSEWKQRLVALIDSCPLADSAQMGFPADWRRRSFWNGATS